MKNDNVVPAKDETNWKPDCVRPVLPTVVVAALSDRTTPKHDVGNIMGKLTKYDDGEVVASPH